MENKDAMDVAFFFNQQMFEMLSEDEKMNMLLVIQEILDTEMKKLVLITPKNNLA